MRGFQTAPVAISGGSREGGHSGEANGYRIEAGGSEGAMPVATTESRGAGLDQALLLKQEKRENAQSPTYGEQLWTTTNIHNTSSYVCNHLAIGRLVNTSHYRFLE